MVGAIQRSSLGQLSVIGKGKEGVVYRAGNLQADGRALFFKEYKPSILDSRDFSVLAMMVEFLGGMTQSQGEEFLTYASWPLRVVTVNGRGVGFVMQQVPDEFFVELTAPSGAVSRRLLQMQLLLVHDQWLSNRGISVSDHERYLLVAALVRAMTMLHRHGIVVGDLSANNVVFSLHSVPSVQFIDCDAMLLNGYTVGPQLETPLWKVSDLNTGEQLATKASDRYKLGLFALRLFGQEQNLYEVSELPTAVHSQVRTLISRSLSPDPDQRPRLTEWRVPLAVAARTSAEEERNRSGATVQSHSKPKTRPTPLIRPRSGSGPKKSPRPPSRVRRPSSGPSRVNRTFSPSAGRPARPQPVASSTPPGFSASGTQWLDERIPALLPWIVTVLIAATLLSTIAWDDWHELVLGIPVIGAFASLSAPLLANYAVAALWAGFVLAALLAWIGDHKFPHWAPLRAVSYSAAGASIAAGVLYLPWMLIGAITAAVVVFGLLMVLWLVGEIWG